MKKILTNSKSNVVRNLGLALLLIAPIVMQTSCKKDDPEPVTPACTDYTNPNCPNYDPYYVLRQDSARLTGKFRQDFVQMNSDEMISNSFMWRFNNHLQGSTILKDSVDATDIAIDEMHVAYGNPITGATTEQNATVDSTKQTCVNWFNVYTQLGHTRD